MRDPRDIGLFDPERHRQKAVEFSEKARAVSDEQMRSHLDLMQRTSLLLARNAEWVRENDEFLEAWRDATDADDEGSESID
jgi:hypothetical protein